MSITASGIAFDRAGPPGAAPIVLLHAGVADRRMWDSPWGRLSRSHDCVRLDLRGFGESTKAPTGRVDHVADLLATLDELGIEAAHVVGSSYGAGVAVETALTAPARVGSLLLCPPGGSLLAAMTPDLRAFLDAENEALSRDDLDAAVRANVDTWLVGPDRAPDDVDPALAAQVGDMQRRAFEVASSWGEVEEAELDPPALERLGQLRCPVLVLIGGHDLLTTRDAAQRVCEGAPDARRVDWPDTAHLPSMERPEQFAELVEEWVDGRPG